MAERRRFMRFDALFEVFYNAFGTPNGKQKSEVRDLSRDGIRLASSKNLPKGSLIEIEMNIPGDNMPIFATGEVAWSARVTESKFQSGVRITKIESLDRARLLDYVYSEWIKTKDEK